MEKEDVKLVWGIKAIAKEIDRTERQTYYLLSTGKLPAKQVGNRWVAEKGRLLRHLMDTAA